MFVPGEVISYLDMCREEGVNFQRGMNFRIGGDRSVLLMSIRPGAPYADRVENEGRVLIYEGHDVTRTPGGPDPKAVDQSLATARGTATQNSLFAAAAEAFKARRAPAERVRVYEKIRSGIWVYAGAFHLVDAWAESAGSRRVRKFRLELADEQDGVDDQPPAMLDLDHTRLIPTAVKLAVWKRDGGKCVRCGSGDNLHFDHVVPYSKGGSSLVVENVQLLCARHNLAKRARIE